MNFTPVQWWVSLIPAILGSLSLALPGIAFGMVLQNSGRHPGAPALPTADAKSVGQAITLADIAGEELRVM